MRHDKFQLVAVADVDALVTKGPAIDTHPRINTTSGYMSARGFAMLPARFSTDLTPLNADPDPPPIGAAMVGAPPASNTPATLHPWAGTNTSL